MSRYRIELTKKAQKFIRNQQQKQQERIIRAIHKLPDEGDIKPLSGRNGAYRLRVGDYRIVYEMNNDILLITVVDVGNRGQIYKRL